MSLISLMKLDEKLMEELLRLIEKPMRLMEEVMRIKDGKLIKIKLKFQ